MASGVSTGLTFVFLGAACTLGLCKDGGRILARAPTPAAEGLPRSQDQCRRWAQGRSGRGVQPRGHVQ